MAEYTYSTIYDEVVAALDFSTSGVSFVTEATVMRLAYRNLIGTESTFTAQQVATGIYVAEIGYGYWLLPTFEGETESPTDIEYLVNCTGSIEVTTGTHSEDSISVSATQVNFPMLMCDVLRYIADNYSTKAAQSFGSTSISPATVRQECMRQASHWTSEWYLNS